MIKWHEVPVLRPGFNGFGQIDPYIDWSFGTGRSKLFVKSERSRFPLLLQLQDGLSASDFSTGAIFGHGEKPDDWKENVRVPPIYLHNGDGFGGCSYFTTFVTKRFFKYFSEQDWGNKLVRAIARMAVSGSLRDHTFPVEDPAAEPGQQSPIGNAENGTVVVGVIDDGIAFANERFRTADNRSRVEHIWLQDGTYKATAARYGYGCSLSKRDASGGDGIDTLLSRSTYSGLVDEDEVYARAGAIAFGGEGPSKEIWVLKTGALRASHGTHVMDAACGYAPGTAPKNESTRGEDSRPIVCVQLPAASSEGTSGASLDTFAVDGVRYILDKADEIARSRGCGRLPVVINFSYGTIAGRHDGTSDIERAIDELIGARQGTPAPVQVVMPAGNSRLKKCHAQVSFERGCSFFTRGSVKSLYWRVLPDDRTTSHLEIWLPRGAAANRIKVSVKPPFGEASPPVKENLRPIRVWGETVDEGLCEVRYCHVPEPTYRGMYLITLKPTMPVEDPTQQLNPAVVPAGVWTIQLENVSFEPEQVVEAWVQRDDTRYGHSTFGRQSYFDHAEYVSLGEDCKIPERDEPKSAVRRAGTLNPIATGRHTIVIGGFRRKDFLPADYSGEGAVVSRVGPDALAVSDDSIVHSGLLAAGTRSGSVIALTGTSVAVPQITRMVANLLAEGKPADRAAIRVLAEAEEDANPHRPRPLSEQRGGKGRIERPPTVSVRRVDESS